MRPGPSYVNFPLEMATKQRPGTGEGDTGVVTETKKAVKVLQALHATVQEREVVFMNLSNSPGQLASLAQKLAEAGINIEYAYCTSTPSQPTGNMVLRTNAIEETINVLS